MTDMLKLAATIYVWSQIFGLGVLVICLLGFAVFLATRR